MGELLYGVMMTESSHKNQLSKEEGWGNQLKGVLGTKAGEKHGARWHQHVPETHEKGYGGGDGSGWRRKEQAMTTVGASRENGDATKGLK